MRELPVLEWAQGHEMVVWALPEKISGRDSIANTTGRSYDHVSSDNSFRMVRGMGIVGGWRYSVG